MISSTLDRHGYKIRHYECVCGCICITRLLKRLNRRKDSKGCTLIDLHCPICGKFIETEESFSINCGI